MVEFSEKYINPFTDSQNPSYEDSLKYYRDMKNSLDTAKQEAKEEKALEIAKELLKIGVSVEDILNSTGLTKEQIQRLKK